MLADTQGWISGFFTEMFIIVLLVISGIWLVFGNFRKYRVYRNHMEFVQNMEFDDRDFITQTTIFGGVDIRSDSRNVYGGIFTEIF